MRHISINIKRPNYLEYSVRNSQKYLVVIWTNLGCPIKPAKQACSPRLRGGPYRQGAAKDPQKLWGKWCKILHSGYILAHKSQLQIVGFFLKFLTSHKAPRSSGLKGANICNLAISWHINQLF